MSTFHTLQARRARVGFNRVLLRVTLTAVLTCLAAVFALPARSQTKAQTSSQTGPSLLTSALRVHSLSPAIAAQGLPVRLRGVITYYDPYIDPRRAALFIQDASGGIFVAAQSHPALAVHGGMLVEISGVTAPGDYAPIVTEKTLRVIEDPAPLPPSHRVTLSHLLTGVEDSNWVAVEGMVHSVRYFGRNLTLRVMTDEGPITVLMVHQDGVDYSKLIDAKVLLHGASGVLFNKKRQLTGIRVMVPDMDAITIEDAPSPDPFALPVRPLNSVMQYGPGLELPHRLHVRGRVTLNWPGRSLCIQNGNDGLCVQSTEKLQLSAGELVDVAGFPALINFEPTLSDATVRKTGDIQPVAPRKVTATEATTAAHSAELVRIEGRLIGKSEGVNDYALLLSSGKILFPAILPHASNMSGGPFGSDWAVGSRISVTGIFSAKIDALKTSEEEGVARLESFQILLRSPADIVLLDKPSWWNGEHTLIVLSAVVMLTLAVAVWVAVLRQRVQQQTQVIRLSEERFRRLAQQDSLTGLASRAFLHEHLQMAIGGGARDRKPVALLMMDLDNFKEVNDSLGHHAGDIVLCTTAERIRSCVRKSDLVARMGGDEFVVLLPDAPPTSELVRIASEMVALVAVPIEIEGHEVAVSMSVGIATYPQDGRDPVALLKNVDAAMYRAKSRGRNCYQVFTPDMPCLGQKNGGARPELTALAGPAPLS